MDIARCNKTCHILIAKTSTYDMFALFVEYSYVDGLAIEGAGKA